MQKGVSNYVRNAQAAEVMRSSFYLAKDQLSFIPVEDLDQLVAAENVRPSLFIGAFEVAGAGLGVISRFTPKVLSDVIAEAVDESAIQQFNDSVRDMQLDQIENVDLKETLKYHRDLRGSDSGDASMMTEPGTNGNVEPNVYLDRVKNVATTALYQLLKISERY